MYLEKKPVFLQIWFYLPGISVRLSPFKLVKIKLSSSASLKLLIKSDISFAVPVSKLYILVFQVLIKYISPLPQ